MLLQCTTLYVCTFPEETRIDDVSQELAYFERPALDVQLLYTGTSGPNHYQLMWLIVCSLPRSSTFFCSSCSAAVGLQRKQRPNLPNVVFQPRGPARQSFLHQHLPPVPLDDHEFRYSVQSRLKSMASSSLHIKRLLNDFPLSLSCLVVLYATSPHAIHLHFDQHGEGIQGSRCASR